MDGGCPLLEEGLAELLFTAWSGESGLLWSDLPLSEQRNWDRVARLVYSMELDWAGRIVKDKFRKTFTERMLARKKRWQDAGVDVDTSLRLAE